MYKRQVLGAHLAERGVGEVRNVLLRGGTVVEHLLGVCYVYLLCKLLDCGLLGRGETFEFEFLNGDVFFLLKHGGLGLINTQLGGDG